jgi:hypothetical protein
MGQSISSHSSIDCPEDFCKFCRGLAKVAIRNGPAKGEDQANALRVEVPHHETMIALKDSAKSGCSLCKLLLESPESVQEPYKMDYTISHAIFRTNRHYKTLQTTFPRPGELNVNILQRV